MNERYLMILENYQVRDYATLSLFLVAIAALMFFVIVETSPLLSTRRPFWRNIYWAGILGSYLAGLIFMAIKY